MAVSRLTQTTLQNGFEKFARVWDGRSAVGSMEPISAITLSSAQASVEFNNIPGTYSHLQIRGIAKVVNNNAIAVNGLIQFNNDTGSNYSRHLLQGNGSAASATGSGSQTSIFIGPFPDNNLSTVRFGPFIIDILDYANTNKFKTIRSFCGYEMNDETYGLAQLASGSWQNTSAITSIRIFGDNRNIDSNSSFSLYGIK